MVLDDPAFESGPGGRSHHHNYRGGLAEHTLEVAIAAEAVVLGVTELMHNGNEAKTNALGHTERSHKKEGLSGSGVMGTLQVRDIKTGVEFEIGTGFTAAERQDIWRRYHSARPFKEPGWMCKYKHFPSGAKDKPRHPVFLGWRDNRDL